MPGSWTELIRRRWGVDEFNTPTETYLGELTNSLGPPAPPMVTPFLPGQTVESFDKNVHGGTGPVPPFYGDDLARWSRACLGSPYSMILSRVTPSLMTEVRTSDGSIIRAGLVASVPSDLRPGSTVREWLLDLAAERGVEVRHSSAVRRLIFNDGLLVGALLDMPEGLRHVRARHGVLLGTSCSGWDDALAMRPAEPGADSRLCVVSRPASRFARLEMLTSVRVLSGAAAPGRALR
jgi:hypothetical protein